MHRHRLEVKGSWYTLEHQGSAHCSSRVWLAVDDDATTELSEQLGAAKQRQRTADAELEKAKLFAQSREPAWERLEVIINEARYLAAAWDKAGAK